MIIQSISVVMSVFNKNRLTVITEIAIKKNKTIYVLRNEIKFQNLESYYNILGSLRKCSILFICNASDYSKSRCKIHKNFLA